MQPTFVVQISDPHIREPERLAYRRLNTAPYLAKAVSAIQQLPQTADAVVITGDLTDFGRIEEYQHLKELLAPLAIPVFLLPGNHDHPANLRTVFPEHHYLQQTQEQGFIQYTAQIGDLVLLALDTSELGLSSGRLCAQRLEWLRQTLDTYNDQPVLIAMHHPPFNTLIGHMDMIGLLEGKQELETILNAYPNVERIICGHIHRAIETRFARTIASTCPSPAHQVCLDLAPEAESAWNLEPPALAIHAWDPTAQRLVSHLAMIGDYEGPYPFHENGVLID